MPFRSLGLIVLLLASLAGAGPRSTQKRLQSRGQVDEQIDQLLHGASVPNVVSRLRYIGERDYAVEALVDHLRGVLEDRLRRNLVAALAGLEERRAEPALVKLATDPDSTVRMYAAQGLGKLHSKNVLVLVPLLEDKSLGVRKEAAKALGASRNPAMGKLLINTASKEPELEARAEMLIGAGRAGDARQAPALKAYLTSDSESTRFAAAKGLCLLGSEDGFAFASKLLASTDKYVRRQGLELYEGAPAKKASPVLSPLLKDGDHSVAAAAARLLYLGGDKTMLDWLVVSSFEAQGDDKLAYEKELESLQLADDQRKDILRKAGKVK